MDRPTKRLKTENLPTDEISGCVAAILLASRGKGGAESDVEARVLAAKESHAAFATKYPKLTEMACEATTDDAQRNVMKLLGLMLDQIRTIDAHGDAHGEESEAIDRASVIVGQAIADRYLPKQK